MRRKFFTIILLLCALAYGSTQVQTLGWFGHSPVYAYGGLSVNWGVPSGSPIFVIANMLPGDSVSRTITVTNGSPSPRVASLWGTRTSPPNIFPGVLDIVISEGSTEIYGGTSSTGAKTLAQFFTDSTGFMGIPLSVIPAGASRNYTIKVYFPTASGNEYQNLQVVFNLKLGIMKELPDDCKKMKFHGRPIFGSHKHDKIYGTRGNDLIYGLEGNDEIHGGGGDDCIIGGPGDDDMHGDDGDDHMHGDDDHDDDWKDHDRDHKDDKKDDKKKKNNKYNDRSDGGRGHNSCESKSKKNCDR